MTPPTRAHLAPLLTLSESDDYWLRRLDKAEHAAFSLVVDYLRKAVAEIDAQRAALASALNPAPCYLPIKAPMPAPEPAPMPALEVGDVVRLDGFGFVVVRRQKEAQVMQGSDGIITIYRPVWQRQTGEPT